MDKHELMEIINGWIVKNYKTIKLDARKYFKNNIYRIGHWELDDVVQEAVVETIEYFDGLKLKKLKERANIPYVMTTIMNTVKRKCMDAFRENDIHERHSNKIAVSLYDESDPKSGLEGFEEVETQEAKDKLSVNFKCFTRLLQDGVTDTEIREKFGISSARRFYGIQENVQETVEKLGYDK